MLLDINHARIVHLEWELKLESILKGHGRPTKVTSHNHCMLGSWLYTEGLNRYQHIPEIKKLEELHKTFHVIAQQVLNEHARKRDASASELFNEVKFLSKETVFLLTMIELRVLHRKQKMEIVRHPLRSLKRMFTG